MCPGEWTDGFDERGVPYVRRSTMLAGVAGVDDVSAAAEVDTSGVVGDVTGDRKETLFGLRDWRAGRTGTACVGVFILFPMVRRRDTGAEDVDKAIASYVMRRFTLTIALSVNPGGLVLRNSLRVTRRR